MDRRGHVTAGKGLGRIASVASAAVMALSLVVGAVVPSPSAAAAAAAETDAAPAPVVSTPAGTVVGPLVAGDQGVNPDEDDQVDAVLDAFAGDDVVHDFVGFYRWSSATYEVHAKRGSVTFQRVWDGNGYTYPIVSVTGENPFANTDPEQPWAPDDATATLSERARPYPYERLSALFDAPDAPDLAVEPHWRNDPSTATHSRMEGHSSRALFVVSGPGFNHEGIVDRHAKQVDLAPTLAALVGAPLVDGRYKGQPATGLRVKWQDGDPLEDVLDGTHPERTLVVTLDQGFTPLVLDMFDKGELPNLRSLVDDGTMYRYGLVANYPSDTLPSNSVLATGAWSGHTGVTGNHIYDRDAGVVWDPVEPEWFAVSDLYTSPEVETLFDLADRTFPGAWTVSADSPIHRGADTASAPAEHRLPRQARHDPDREAGRPVRALARHPGPRPEGLQRAVGGPRVRPSERHRVLQRRRRTRDGECGGPVPVDTGVVDVAAGRAATLRVVLPDPHRRHRAQLSLRGQLLAPRLP